MPKLARIGHDTNTTSTIWSPINGSWYPYSTLAKLLERHLVMSPEYIVLCMHHLDIRRPYRGCSVKSGSFIYFMLNPVITGSTGDITVYEDSVSCSELSQARKRRKSIEVRWSDGNSELRGSFGGDVAISMQLALDEFDGNGHCRFSERESA